MMSHNERGADADWSTIGVRMASSSEEAIELDGDRVALRGDDGSVQLRVLLVEVIVAVPPWTLLPCMVQRVDESGRPRRPAGDARGATRRVWRIRELEEWTAAEKGFAGRLDAIIQARNPRCGSTASTTFDKGPTSLRALRRRHTRVTLGC